MDRSRALVKKSTLGEVDEVFEHELWLRTTPEERFADTWRLSEEIWLLKGWDPGEPGLHRSAVRTLRR